MFMLAKKSCNILNTGCEWEISAHQLKEIFDCSRTAFTSYNKSYRSLIIVTGLKSALEPSERKTNVITQIIKCYFAAVYKSDIIVISKIRKRHSYNVWHVLTLIRKAGTIVKLMNSIFVFKHFENLEHNVRHRQLKIEFLITNTLRWLEQPNPIKVLISFLGLRN